MFKKFAMLICQICRPKKKIFFIQSDLKMRILKHKME